MATNNNHIIVTNPDQIAEILAPYFDHLADKAIERAMARASDDGRMVKYEEARRITGLGKTQFSRAVNDGTIPHYPNGLRGKLFRVSDLREFQGYQPKTEAQKRFENELAGRK